MPGKFLYTFIVAFLLSINIYAQIPGININFNDGEIDGWVADHPNTFGLEASDSVLKINYNRSASSSQWDNFNYTPPKIIDPSANPNITVKVKTNIPTQLTCKPIYSNGSDDWLQKDIQPANDWQDVSFGLVNFKNTTISKIYWYLDGGSNSVISGIVLFDNVEIGSEEPILLIKKLDAQLADSNIVNLKWEVNFPNYVSFYNIYRGDKEDFECDNSTFIESTNRYEFIDQNLEMNKTYYYKISAVDINNAESLPSDAVRIRTSSSGNKLMVEIDDVNSRQIGLYEIFEAKVIIENAIYDNPFNPMEMDLSCKLTSPNGAEWKINGFYDNYNNSNTWKIRFSPNEVGEWNYELKIINRNDTAHSMCYSFESIESEHHGWLKVSKNNPYYFEHDDGTSFYGVGAFYPWNVNNGSDGLEYLEMKGANLWAYWNISYDDGTIIESLNSGLGRYDQKKAGRIDQLLVWSADRNMKMMLSIWPHDLISETVWATEWHNNPYNTICESAEWFSDEEAWEYQKKQYRYIIARWGCFRSLAFYEIVNEINGTDAWAAGNNLEGTEWIKKVDHYFEENDPYEHPTTASKSGGHYWIEGYNYVDIPNVHLYETSWRKKYIGNNLRSSLYVYQNISQNFRKDFKAPALMGEAGYIDTYGRYVTPSDKYTKLYHNAIWTTWANGNASTPLWWEFNRKDIMSPEVMDQMEAFSKIAGKIDYANNYFIPGTAEAEKCDIFVMVSDSIGFGWLRQEMGENISYIPINIFGVKDTIYSLQWFDSWSGEPYHEVIIEAANGNMEISVPSVDEETGDIAFIYKAVKDDYTDIKNNESKSIAKYALFQNYPNPFNSSTNIRFQIPSNSNVKILLFDMLGRKIATILDEEKTKGNHNINLNTKTINPQLASGMYLIVMQSSGFTTTQKCLYLK